MDFINQLVQQGIPVYDAVLMAGKTRLRPVLLTALTTVIGLLPMALGVSFDFHNFSYQSGSESASFWSPMAWTVIFGLSFATVLTLLVVPLLVYLDYRLSAFFSGKKIQLGTPESEEDLQVVSQEGR